MKIGWQRRNSALARPATLSRPARDCARDIRDKSRILKIITMTKSNLPTTRKRAYGSKKTSVLTSPPKSFKNSSYFPVFIIPLLKTAKEPKGENNPCGIAIPVERLTQK